MELAELIPNDVLSDDGEIYILVGADYYWSLVTDDIIRLDEKLVAIRSKLGYILNQVVIPRCCCVNEIQNPISRIELIGTSDASPAAHGACVYERYL